MASDPSPWQVLFQRIIREYEEQPGLRLTRPQAQRLWDLDAPTCSALLAALLDAGVLRQTSDGRFMRQ